MGSLFVLILLLRRQGVPGGRLPVAGEQSLDPSQYPLNQVEPDIAHDKYYHKEQEKSAWRSHLVAKRFMKKSVKAANASSWET